MKGLEKIFITGILAGAIIMGTGGAIKKKIVSDIGFGVLITSICGAIKNSKPKNKKKYDQYPNNNSDYMNN